MYVSLRNKRRLWKVPAISDGDDAGTVLSDFKEHEHGEVEVWSRRVTPVTPSSIVARESVVGRAEVCSGYEDGRVTGVTPLWVIGAFDFET